MKKMTMNEEGDRISNFPDEIIHKILSLGDMTDMTKIVRTSVLSKRWRYLWTSAPNLDFDFLENDDELENYNNYCCDSDDGLGRLGKFFNFINHFLSPSYTSSINKLSIQCYASMDYQLTTKFIAAALKRNVQEIHLHCNFDSGGELTDLLFTFQVRVFKFANYSKDFKDFGKGGIRMPRSIAAAPYIRILELKNVVLPTISGEVIINGSVLEDLKIKNCHIYDARTFAISAPLLNKLELKRICCRKDYMYLEKNYCICIRSSNLEYLVLSDYEFSGNFTLENPSTLTTADLNLHFKDYKKQSPQCLMKVLAEISNVKTLIVPYHLLEVMANSPSALELLARRFLNLRNLVMFEDFTGYFSCNAVATVLQTFPRRVDPILHTREVVIIYILYLLFLIIIFTNLYNGTYYIYLVDPISQESLKKLLEQKDVSSSKSCQREYEKVVDCQGCCSGSFCLQY